MFNAYEPKENLSPNFTTKSEKSFSYLYHRPKGPLLLLKRLTLFGGVFLIRLEVKISNNQPKWPHGSFSFVLSHEKPCKETFKKPLK